MRLTPLHLALGVTGSQALSFDLVQQACTEKVEERDNLDWKRDLPLTLPPGKTTGRDHQEDELAKDIAAMANGRGGLIIYGVAGVSATNDAADKIVAVGQDLHAEQNIRRLATSLIAPPVTDLDLRWLVSPTSPQEMVLAVEVQPSVQAPHFVRPKNGAPHWLAVPYRNGPHTEWMSERMIESAYRDRLFNSRQRERRLRELHSDLVEQVRHVMGGGAATIVAVARPDNPRPPRPRLKRDEAERIMGQVWQTPLPPGLDPWLEGAASPTELLRGSPIRAGLRSLVQHGRREVRTRPPNTAVQRATAEMHFDGSIGLAITRGGSFGHAEMRNEQAYTPIDIDRTALELFTLARETALQLGITGDYEAHLSVEFGGTFIRRPDPTGNGHFIPAAEDTDRVGPFRPVTGPFVLSQGEETALDSLVDFAADAVNQVHCNTLLEPLRPG